MKSFEYAVRDASGTLREGVQDGNSREEVLARLRSQGGVVVRVNEVRKSAATVVSPFRRKEFWFGMAVAVVVVLVLSSSWSGKRKPVREAKQPKKPTPVQTAQTKQPPVPKVVEKPVEQPIVEPIPAPTVQSKKNTLPLGKPGQLVVTPGRQYKIDADGNAVEYKPKRLFDNPFENMLVGMAVSEGTFIPGIMKQYPLAAVKEILAKPVVINPTDSEADQITKEAVAALKTSMSEYLAKGGTYENFVDEMYAIAKEERQIGAEGRKNLVAFMNFGTPQEARAYYESVNAALAQKGLPPLRLPERLKKQLNGLPQ